MKEKIKPIINKIKNILSNKKTLIGVSLFTLVMIIVIIISTIILNKGTVPTLRNKNWTDFSICIDGNTVTLGTEMKNLEKMGFILINLEYIDKKLNPQYVTGGIEYTYKNETNKYNTIYFSAHNNTKEYKDFDISPLNGIEINQNFYKNYEIILPKGLILDETLTIDAIINKWNEPTSIKNNLYQWKNDQGLINIYNNIDNTIFSIIYNK